MRWSRQLVLKAEYRHTTENPGTVAEGLLGSVALFF